MSFFRKIDPKLRLAEGPHVCDYQCWDWSKGSEAIVASDGERAVILDHIGGPLDYWLGESGETNTFDGLEAGVWIWFGRINAWRSYEGEYDEELDGDFRELTDEEWELIKGGDALWADSEWRRCPDDAERLIAGLVNLSGGMVVIRGFAPGVDAATNTFTCPECSTQRDCQALNPLCLACGYHDPRHFEPAEIDAIIGDYVDE